MKTFLTTVLAALILASGVRAQPGVSGAAVTITPPPGVLTSSIPFVTGIFLPSSYGTITDGGTFGDGLAHPASSNGFATLGSLQAVYPFATALSDDMAGLMIQAAINAANVNGYGTVQLFNGKFRTLPGGWIFPANTNAKLNGVGAQVVNNGTALLCANSGTNPCVTVNQQYGRAGPVSNLAFWGMNSIVHLSVSAGGTPQTNIYNPGTVGMLLVSNAVVTYENLAFFNFDMTTDWDTVTGGNYIITFKGIVAQDNNRGDVIAHAAPNSFEKITYTGGVSANNNYNGWFMLQTAGTTIGSGTYNNSTGAVSLTTAVPHGLTSGSLFSLAGVTGTGSNATLNSTFSATTGTTGSTLNFSVPASQTMTITGGNVIYLGGGTAQAEDVHLMDRSYDYPGAMQMYYLGLGSATDHFGAVYFTSGHIETSATQTGTGARIQHNGDLDLSQSDWLETGSNVAAGGILQLTANARTWSNGGKGPGQNTSDTATMPLINTNGGLGTYAGGVGLGNRVPGTSVLLLTENGNISGYKAYDPNAEAFGSNINYFLSKQTGPLRFFATATVTIPPNTTSPLAQSTATILTADPGAVVTFSPGAGVSISGPLSFGGINGGSAWLTGLGTNFWAVTPISNTGGATTASAGAVTLNAQAGVVTSEALTGATTYTLVLTNALISSGSTVVVNATDSAGLPVTLTSVTPGSGSATVVVGMAALTGTVKIAFLVK